MPESDLATRLARLEQAHLDLRSRVDLMSPLVEAMAEMRSDVRHMDENMEEVKREVLGIKGSLKKRDDAVSQERRQTRLALWSLVGVLGAAIIAAIGAVIAAGIA